MQLRYKGRTTFLRIFDDIKVWPSETEVSAAFKRLTSLPPKIGFLTGDFERSIDKVGDDAYSALTNRRPFRYSLINQGFDIESVHLDSTHDVPKDIAALVIADPRSAIKPAAAAAIRKYIAAGGNLMILGKPGKQAILNPLLSALGVRLKQGEILQDSSAYAQNIAAVYLTKKAAQWSPTLGGAFADSTIVSMPGACGFDYKDSAGFKVIPLLMTDSSKSWNHTGTIVLDSTAMHYNPSAGDERDPFATTIALTRTINGKEQRIIVSGDADMMSNAELSRRNMGRTANFQFNTALFGWFTYGKFPVDSYRPRPRDHYFMLSDGGLRLVKVLFLWGLPVSLLLLGTILLIRRRRK
jgi:ABC-2 type transport system permease protein